VAICDSSFRILRVKKICSFPAVRGTGINFLIFIYMINLNFVFKFIKLYTII